ncbi:DUF6210 family protein [Sorangium sp. So ce1097]|uniref:DUF6210 family protein n=1 Tax=Sorangium sp. So ce1097 TaxID=3133330 RepID=UPI003F6319F9
MASRNAVLAEALQLPPEERAGNRGEPDRWPVLDDEDAAFIEMLLAKHGLSGLISLDRSRLRESHEAWVWAMVTGDGGDHETALFRGLGPYPREAVLTWDNTD